MHHLTAEVMLMPEIESTDSLTNKTFMLVAGYISGKHIQLSDQISAVRGRLQDASTASLAQISARSI